MVCSFILTSSTLYTLGHLFNAKKLVNIKEVSYNMQVTR